MSQKEAKETKAKPAEKKSEASETKKVKAAAATKETKTKKVAKKKTTSASEVHASTPAKACQIKGCKREYRAKGYCGVHYKKWRNGEYGKARYTPCSDVGCFKPQAINRLGFCEDHYQNYYVKGMAAAKVEAPKKDTAPKTEEKAAS